MYSSSSSSSLFVVSSSLLHDHVLCKDDKLSAVSATKVNDDDHDNDDDDDDDDDCRAKQVAASLWFNRGNLSYQAVPSVRVSVSTEHINKTPVCPPQPCGCNPPCLGPCQRAQPFAAAGVSPICRCGCRPPCPGRCRKASPPPPPPPPPRKLLHEKGETMNDRLVEAETRGLVQKPPKPRVEPTEEEDPTEKYKKQGLGIGKGAMITSGD